MKACQTASWLYLIIVDWRVGKIDAEEAQRGAEERRREERVMSQREGEGEEKSNLEPVIS